MRPEHRGRKPQAFDADDPDFIVTPDAAQHASREADAESPVEGKEERTQEDAAEPAAPVAPAPARGGMNWGGLLAGSLASLAVLAAGVWFSSFIEAVLARGDWIGWLGFGLAGLAALAGTVLILKEIIGLMRLTRLTRLRREAEAAQRKQDPALERRVVKHLKSHFGRSREGQWDLDRFREEERHMREPGALMGLAERVLLARPDAQARRAVYESARRVGVVTAVVPIGFVVVGFVLFENLRMVRRLAAAYGGRPGFLGGLRLFTWIIGHMAATGIIALTDDLWGQLLGQDVLRRVSRKLGEGAFNGAMTARLGVAAIAVCRPLPFNACKPPRARHIFYEAFPELKPALPRKMWTAGGREAARQG